MSESHPSELPALTTPPPSRFPAWRQPALWLSGAALLVTLVFGWQAGERAEATRAELARRLGDSDAAQKEAQAHAKQNREALDALQAKVGALDAQLAEMQNQQLALETMYQELSRVRDDRLIAEIEQAVSIAAQQLQLAGNVEAALIALTGAETRLAKNNQPQFLSLRKLIVRDIERLKTLPAADVSGIALKLDGLLNAVATLPLASDHRPAPVRADKKAPPPAATPAPPGWQSMLEGLLAELWQEVRQLVRIERIDRPDPGLLSPRETFFLRENLRLRLLSARLALLARDGRTFRSDLQQAREWLDRYFDSQAPVVKEAQATLNVLGKLDIMREPAELNETLSSLRNFKLARDRASERATR
jgi:uroporphyrin-3 C-methyltransferase